MLSPERKACVGSLLHAMYGISRIPSVSGGPNSLRGSSTDFPTSDSPDQHTATDTTGFRAELSDTDAAVLSWSGEAVTKWW